MVRRDRPKKVAEKKAVMAARTGKSPFDDSECAAERHAGVAVTGESAEPVPEVLHSQDEAAMVRRAAEVLGIDYVAGWMRRRIPSLDNQTPYTLLKTEDGRKQVERVLLKIEHGVY